MAHKHLHELLQEDQEPFLLKNYISDRKCKPITTDTSISKHSLYKQACFFSFKISPDLIRKSPSKTSNAVTLHIPARTAALLLESATRIHRQSSARKQRTTQISNLGLGLLGSIFKRLSSKSQSRNRENTGGKGEKLNGNVEDESVVEMGFSCSCNDDNSSRRNSGVWSGRKSAGKGEKMKESAIEMGYSCGCNTSRSASTIWSESNEEKSLDLESASTSSRSDEFGERENDDFGFCGKGFCSSPSSPFRFALEASHSSGDRTPVFLSPATSPTRHMLQERENSEVLESMMVEEEEEKEQFSPVSVLDPPFEDDDDNDCNEEGSYDLECSYAIVQRAKQQLLHKLRRFEKLAELDPIELEKRMSEEQEDHYDNIEDEEEEFKEDVYARKNTNDFVREVLSELGFHFNKVPTDMERLVSDLIAEEKREDDGTNDGELVVKRVCKRLASWKEEKSNTIDMMVDLDFRRESDGWKRTDKNQVREAAMEIEQSIFRLLVEELSVELMVFSGESSLFI